MEQMRYTTAEALGVLDAVLSSIDHGERAWLAAQERVVLMAKARKVQERVTSLAGVLTDEASRVSVAATGTPITSLLAMEEGRDSGDAARQVFEAGDMARHEAVKQAALDGDVSARHAAAIGKAMAQLPAGLSAEQTAKAERAFLEKAARNTPKRLAELAPQVLAEVAPELTPTAEDEEAKLVRQRRRALAKRAFGWGDDGDGSMWFKGSLPHLEAESLISVVEAYAQADRRAARDRFAATRAAGADRQAIQDASAELSRTPAQRRADALVRLVSEHRDAPSSVGDRPRIVVTMTHQDLHDMATAAGVLPAGVRITAGDLRRLCCDADLMPAVLGAASEILDVGRTQRLVTPAIRKALSLRDGGCVFPGCTAPDSACEAHHLRPWWQGGVTALYNLVLLCPHHHRLVEPERYQRPTDRWSIHIDSDTGQPVITPPRRTHRFTAWEDSDPSAASRKPSFPHESSPPVLGSHGPPMEVGTAAESVPLFQ